MGRHDLVLDSNVEVVVDLKMYAVKTRDAAVFASLQLRDKQAADLLRKTQDYSLLSQRKRMALYQLARSVDRQQLPGDIVEMGAHRGGGAGMFTELMRRPGRTLHLFDRWGEVPTPSAVDGAFASSNYARSVEMLAAQDPLTDIKHLMRDVLRIPDEQLAFHQGWLSDTLARVDGDKICLAHVDVNLYESTREVFQFFEHALADRALVALDDWGDAWPGVQRAYTEWNGTTKRKLTLRPGRQQAIVLVGDTSQ